jgi:7-cyano-7-deazaguanine synthase
MDKDTTIQGRRVMVLLSGGIDSTATIAFYLEHQCDVECLFIDYGQIASPKEVLAARQVAAHYKVPIREVTSAGMRSKSTGMLLGRNAFFLFTALMEFNTKSGIVAIGIHAGTEYYDCSIPFAEKAQNVFEGYTDGCIRIGVPFIEWTKPTIWDYCHDRSVPVHLTYSCELGKKQPCGECSSCRDIEALDARAKFAY